MKTDEEVTERLRRASSGVQLPPEPLERLHLRRGANRRRDRLAAGILAMALVVGAVGGSLFALREIWNGVRKSVGSGQGTLVGPTSAPSPGSLALGPGEYFYMKTQIVLSPEGKVIIETWWATDGSGRISAFEYEGAQYGLPPKGTFGAGEFPVESDVSHLSTDPATLLGQLRDRSAPGGASPQPDVTPGGEGQTPETGRLWRAVKRLLEYANATPELRAALIQVGREIPGVRFLDAVTDPVGRQADGIDLTIEGATERITYEPTNLQPLGIESTPVDDPKARTYEVFLEGIVGSTEDRPTGDQWLTPEPV